MSPAAPRLDLALLASLALLLLALPLSLAFDEINTPSTITAGTDATIKIVNDLSQGSRSFDAQFDSYRLYLALSPPGWGSAPACYVVNSSAINVTSQTIQIPASIGPSDRLSQAYAVVATEFNQDPNAGGPSGFQYSNFFDFVGGTGNWSQYELDGYVPGDPDFTPCSAYDCTRQCSQRYYPDNVNSNSASALKPTYDCWASCPGTSYPPFDSLFGGSGGPAGGGSSSGSPGDSTLGAVGGTTSLRAAGGFTQINSALTSTGSGASSAAATASPSQVVSTVPSSGASTASSTGSASTPTASKSAASLVSSSQFAVLGASVTFLLSLVRL